MPARQNINLSLGQKKKLIEMRLNGKKTVKELCAHFKCGKTTVYDCLSKQAEIMEKSKTRYGSKSKRFRKSNFENVNEILFQWFCVARSKNYPLSGPILQAEAIKIASKLNISNFKASNGWLRSLRKRYHISFNTICGESNDVDETVMSKWIAKLFELCDGYDQKNIGNCDETALFFRMLPSKTLNIRGDNCSGGKFSKERITVMLTVFADGTIEKPLVIGKAARPRCFKKLNLDNLGVDYYSNRKAWMTGLIFKQYLTKLNNKMKEENRKILLFLDNAASHANLKLSNIQLVYLPPNTTAKLQPLDFGIIANMKVNYRKLMLQNLLVQMESCSSVSALAKRITILDSIQFLKIACQQISANTVIKCFLNVGFVFAGEEQSNCESSDEEIATDGIVEIQNLIQSTFGAAVCSASDFITIDDSTITEHNSIDIDEIIADNIASGPEEVVSVSDDDLDDITEVGNREVIQAFKTLEIYGRQSGENEFYETVSKLRASYVQGKEMRRKQKQTSILQYFN